MKPSIVFSLLLATLALPAIANPALAQSTFQLTQNDRVVLIGDGLIEQEQYSGWIETMLTASFPKTDVKFRNLGWSGDTPVGQSRFGLSLVQAGNEPQGEGWRQLQKQIELTKPTVAILGYGMASALEDPSCSEFEKECLQLVAKLRQVSPECKIVWLSPISPRGDSAIDDKVIQTITGIIRTIKGNEDYFVDLTKTALSEPLRRDAVHLNDAGYRAVAITIQKSLGLKNESWQTSDQTKSLRQVILEKNRLWFHRSRPANMAYVFGFRKREQGQNAVEIPQYDPLIEKEEQTIASLRSLSADAAATKATETQSPRLKSMYAEFTPQPKPSFVVADGLEVSLWAENPLLNKPIHMNFDPQGRLWVASSEAYPMIEVGQAMPDKVVVLEDTNGDGKADQSSVFADQLLIPTGIAPGDGGVYVAQSTDLLFLKDTNGDGKADYRERVLSGFGTEDTHHNLHTLVFGPDGRLYMNQSVYTRTDAETPHGVVRLKAGGAFRYDTRRRHMDVFFHGMWNPWGHQFDAMGNSFMSDGAGFAGLAYVFPGATLRPTPKARKVLDLISPGSYPKFCGAEIIAGKSFPDDWQGSIITCDFRANRVTRFSLSDDDAGFVTTQESDLIRTSESTFRPIDVKLGPDGALYIADWSNPIINHGEVDFRDPRRDRWHGRIWRVTASGHPLRKTVDLAKQSIDQLTDHLFSGDQYLTANARRVLIETADETRSKLDDIWGKASTTADQLNVIRLSAAVGAPNTNWLSEMLGQAEGATRAAATRILSDWSDPNDPSASIVTDDAMKHLAKRLADDHPRTRLEAIRGLARLNRIDAIELSLKALDHPTDRFIEHALFLSVDDQAETLMKRLQQPGATESLSQQQLEFVLTSVNPKYATQFLSVYLKENTIERDGSGPWIELIGKAGGQQQLSDLFDLAVKGQLDPAPATRAIQAIANAKKFRKVMPAYSRKPLKELQQLVGSEHESVSLAAIELCGAWKTQGMIPLLVKTASGAGTPTRLAVVNSLRACGGKASTDALVSLVDPKGDQQVQTSLVSALAALSPDQAVTPFFALLEKADDEQSALSLWRSMLIGKDAQTRLVASLPTNGVSEIAARAGVRAAGEGEKKAQALIDALLPMSGLNMTASQWTPQRAAEIRRLVSLQGDAARGELIYRRSQLQCATCHAIGGVGGKVGPDMTSLGASAPVDYIIESMFDPNAKIKENYHSVTVLTEEGQVFAGIESGSTEDEMVLRDASNKLVRIPESEIVQVKQGKSLMPAGLLDRIQQSEQLDLIRFLTQLGRPGDYDASRQTVARVLELFAGNHRIEQAGNQAIVSGELVKGWKPLQARVSGKIDRAVLQEMTVQPRNIALVNIYLRTAIEVGSDTQANFSVDNIKSATLWIDGENPTEINDSVQLTAGKHTLLIQIDGRELPESIAIRSEDVTFVVDGQ